MIRADVPPLTPDAGEARRWVLDELAKAEYVQAQPTWFDRLAAWLRDLLASFQPDPVTGVPGLGTVIVLALVAAVLVVAFLVFGVPRLRRRSGVTGALFGENDDRTADRMRADAAAAAASGDFTLAVAELFRALARSLAERGLVSVLPGTTAHEFGSRAGVAFPDDVTSLAEAASDFDGVRYLGHEGTREQYERMLALDGRVRRARPVLETA